GAVAGAPSIHRTTGPPPFFTVTSAERPAQARNNALQANTEMRRFIRSSWEIGAALSSVLSRRLLSADLGRQPRAEVAGRALTDRIRPSAYEKVKRDNCGEGLDG